MSLQRKTYLLTILLVLVSVCSMFLIHLYQTYTEMVAREFVKTESIARLLDKRLTGTYENLLENPSNSLSDQEKITFYNKQLQPIVEGITESFPGYGAGYYVKDLNSIVAFGPNFNNSGLIDISPTSKARTVYETKEPFKFNNRSQTRGANVVATIYPVIRDGKAIGHVWGNITVKDTYTLFLDQIREEFFVLVLMLILAIVGTYYISRNYKKYLQIFRDSVHKTSEEDIAPFFPEELMEVYQDVKISRKNLVESEKRFRDVANAFNEYIWEVNLEEQFTYISERISSVLHYKPEEIIGKHLFEFIYEEDIITVKNTYQKCKQNLLPMRDLEFRLYNKEGQVVWQQVSAIPIVNEQHQFIGYRGAAIDISEQKAREEQIEKLAYFDPVTGITNRNYLSQFLKSAMHNRNEHEQIAVFFLNIERFRNINDSLGHILGDELLKLLSQRIKSIAEPHACFSRFGGDEFIIVLPNVINSEEINFWAEKIQKESARPFVLNERNLFVEFNIGISLFPKDGDDEASLIKNAATAMYQSRIDKQPYQYYHSDMNKHSLTRLDIESDLRKALEQKEFTLYYQPQNDLSTGEIIGTEALIRWPHPINGMISPAEFIPISEETRLIIPISEWVLYTACSQNKAWQAKGLKPITVAVNISLSHFQQSSFVHDVERILSDTGMEAEYLELEITERVAMGDIARVIDTLQRLKQLGVKISIDDFGTGYSSLGYLKDFPVDKLKIDRRFIQRVGVESNDLAIIKTIISLAHNLQMKVLAEGVEEEHQLCILYEELCDSIQGYIFSKPVPADDLEKMLVGMKKLQIS